MNNTADSSTNDFTTVNSESFDNSDLLNRKKIRESNAPKQRKYKPRTPKNELHASKKEEEKILKYALKLSEMEYKEKMSREVKENTMKEKPRLTIHNIEHCTTIVATDEDFKDPIAFFDSIWNKEHSTGIIKIIPPKDWKEKNLSLFKQEFCKKFYSSDKKLDTRKIILNELYKAKVCIY